MVRRVGDGRERRWSESEARAVLDDWRRSGLSLAEFARRRGTSAQRVSWWRKRLPAPAVPVPAGLEMAPLLPVELARASTASVVIESGGVRVEVLDASTTPATWVVDLLCALREGKS